MDPCPLCRGPSKHAFSAGDRNRALSSERFHYRRCRQCRVLFLANVPTDLGRFYGGTYHDLPEPADLHRLAAEEPHRISLVRRFAEPGRLVEVGPGFGLFAYQAREAGFAVTAIEMDPRCCAYLAEVVGVSVVQSDAPEQAFPKLAPSRAICFWHVLEHLPRPWMALEAAAANLEPDGMLFTSTPNPRSFQFSILRGRWPHVDAPRHLFLFPPDLLESRAAELGLEQIFLTSSDQVGRYWNLFGWQRAVMPPDAGAVRTIAARVVGGLVATVLSPVERTALRGSTYTGVFRKKR